MCQSAWRKTNEMGSNSMTIQTNYKSEKITVDKNNDDVYFFVADDGNKVWVNGDGEVLKIVLCRITLVTNVSGSSKIAPKCGNCGAWIQHWGNFTKAEHNTCRVHFCETDETKDRISVPCSSKKELCGAHVELADVSGWFVVPMCGHHNGKHGEELTLQADSVLIRAKQSLMCD